MVKRKGQESARYVRSGDGGSRMDCTSSYHQLDLTGNACCVENCVMKAARRQRISD